MMTAQVRALLSEAGSSAARAGADITDCPFNPGADAHPFDRERARVWVGGYLAARPPAATSVDYTLQGVPEAAAARSLTHPVSHLDDNSLKEYWLHGEGLAKWTTWTELDAHLAHHVDLDRAARIAATWFHERYGFWPGDHRNNLVGSGQ